MTKKKVAAWIPVAISLLTLVFGSGWYQEYQKIRKARQAANEQLVTDFLEPLATLLSINERLFNELHDDKYSEPTTAGILEAYLIRIRRDGVGKNAEMGKRIETLVGNDKEMNMLVMKYLPKARSQRFREQAKAFLDHSIRYVDRWNSLLEVYTSGGNFSTGAPTFPLGFPEAVQEEMGLRLRDGA